MYETDKENDLKMMKYDDSSTGNTECCKSQELALVSELKGAGSSRSHDYKMKNEGKVIFRKKSLLPIFAPNHPYRSACYTVSPNCKNNVSVFTQRIMSAKLLGVRTLQNKLTETQIHLQELLEENRILNALLKRQERALKKYEGEEAQLPQLIKTHSDEMQVLQMKYKQLKATCYDLEQKLKARDTELTCLREQHKHLLHLSKDKHLGERARLQQQVEELLETVNSQESKIKTLMRKVELESKNYKHQLRVEIGKHKETQRQLSQALSSIQKLEAALEMRQKHQIGMAGRLHHFATNATIGTLPAISKQILSSNQISPLKEKLNEKSIHEHDRQEKNESDSNPTTVSSSVRNSEYDGSEVSGNNAKNRKTSNSSTEFWKNKSKQSDSSKTKSRNRSTASYNYNLESSDSTKATNSDQETVKNNEALPDIFADESPEPSKPLPSEKVSSQSSKKSLMRQNSVKEEDASKSSFSSKPWTNISKSPFSQNEKVRKNSSSKEDLTDVNGSRSDSFDSKTSTKLSSYKEVTANNSSEKEDFTWEEIKKQVEEEHEMAKKKLESFSQVNFDSDLLNYSIDDELDNSKKNALLKALNDIDREKNCREAELNSDSDNSLYKNSKFGEDFMSFYRTQSANSKYSPTDDHGPLSADLKEKRNGLVRDWFFNQYDYDIAAKSVQNEREKMLAMNTNNRKGPGSSS